jgi:uncharacterized protein YdeI (YjbR/CyaY-like superfamily)
MGIGERRRRTTGLDALPQELVDALSRSPEAQAIFDGLAPAHRREYVTWIAEARQTVTRERRSAQTVMRLLDSARS